MKKIFHTIRCANKTFTQEEWGDYCSKVRLDDSKRIRTQFGKYVFNDCDICLNPEKEVIAIEKKSNTFRVEISWASCGNGLWSYGLSYNIGTAGGGFGVSWAKTTMDRYHKGYKSERECKVAACEDAVRIVEGHKDAKIEYRQKLVSLINNYKRTIIHGKVVQLELF